MLPDQSLVLADQFFGQDYMPLLQSNRKCAKLKNMEMWISCCCNGSETAKDPMTMIIKLHASSDCRVKLAH